MTDPIYLCFIVICLHYFLFSRYSADEIHFNLMAIVSDRKMCYEKRVQLLCSQLDVSKIRPRSLERGFMASAKHNMVKF